MDKLRGLIFDVVQTTSAIGKAALTERVSSGATPSWKRVLDVGLVLLTAPVWLPVFGFLCLFIKLVSPGPVFFAQERIGLRGRRFVCLKFRSMKVNADVEPHRDYLDGLMKSEKPMTKMDTTGDWRLIPFGAWLRATGLDELPQLINVMRGEMSLVGPRPCIPYEYEGYAPWQMERFNTLPGLTGLWQVSGKNRTTFAEMVRLDIAYARRKSPGLDLIIIFKTPFALLMQVWDTRQGARAPRTKAPVESVFAK